MSDYDPVKCLQEEVDRFKATNQFTPMLVTGFYIQAAVVLDQHKRQKERIAELEAQLAERQRTCDGSCDIALARRQVGPDGYVPGNARECAEMWEREASRLDGERQRLERENAELKSQRNALASLIWETRWVSEDHDYQNLVGIAAEIRSGSLTGLNKETANRDQLLLQVARLREALEKVVRTFGIPAEYDRVAQQALSETPAQAAKEVIGPTLELLDALRRIAWPTELVEKLEKDIARLKRLRE